MSTQAIGEGREAAIWARLMRTQQEELSPEVAEYLLAFRFEEADRERMAQLAERSETGVLTDTEREEFDSYLHVGNLLAVMQSRARQVLRRGPGGGPHA